MTWLRIRLTEEQQRVVNEERCAHPNPRIREKMLVIWLLHNGATRQYAAKIVGVSRATVQRYVTAFREGGLDGLRRWNANRPESEMAAYRELIRESFEKQPVRTIAVSVRSTASSKRGGGSSRWGRSVNHRRPRHGSVVPGNLLVGNSGRFPPLGTDSRRVLPTPPHLHPFLPRLALSAPSRTPSSSLTRRTRLPSPISDQERYARLSAGPCPSSISGAHF